MKKLIFLFVMALGLMSFGGNEKLVSKEKTETLIECCTAYVQYQGQTVEAFTECSSGSGPIANNLACSAANSEAQSFIRGAQQAINDVAAIFGF